MRFEDISYNFNVAKVLSILMVATGHYFGGALWISATFGLVIFGFSSGFFTAQKYHGSYNIKKFWHAKIVRLWCPILIIDIFLLLLFVAQQRPCIWSWQTLPSLLGMNGLLTWFNLANPSPFGVGLWFFTLLVLFYLFYPLLSRLNQRHSIATAFLLISLVLSTIFNYTILMGHMLWMTAFAFIAGAYWGNYSRPIPPWICLIITFISFCLLLSFNTILDYKPLNYGLILITSLSMIGYLLNKRLPNFGFQHTALLSGCVIQIYFIHTYLFVKLPAVSPVINYVISMLIIITVALGLSKLTEKLNPLSAWKKLTPKQ